MAPITPPVCPPGFRLNGDHCVPNWLDGGFLIRTYFPEGAWGDADCIMQHECPPLTPMYPAACVREIGQYKCGDVTMAARAWGTFGLLDVCWDPAIQSGSPFTPEQWARVLDPNYNVWMASRIWSEYGWSVWSTFNQCGIQSVEPGGPIPHPEGPLPELSNPEPASPLLGGFEVGTLIAGLAAIGVSAILYDSQKRGR